MDGNPVIHDRLKNLLDFFGIDSQVVTVAKVNVDESCQEVSGPGTVSQPLVSVCLITYNQKDSIRRAIEGVLEQKADFPFELIIGEDASRDETREVVLEYQRHYPQVIRVLISEGNVGATRNFWRVLKAARGKYLAFLEGDDYWVAPEKLASQCELLAKSPSSMLCAANTQIVVAREEGREEVVGTFVRKSGPHALLRDVLVQQYHVSSCLMRAELLVDIEQWYRLYGNVYDIAMLCLAAKAGPIVYWDKVVSVRRSTGKGVFSVLTSVEQYAFDIKWIYRMYVFFYPDGAKYFLRRLYTRSFEYLLLANRDRSIYPLIGYLRRVFVVSPVATVSLLFRARRQIVSNLLKSFTALTCRRRVSQ